MSAEGIAAFAVVSAALLSLAGVTYGLLFKRVAELERRVSRAESYNRRMWMWARRHVDLYYKHRKDGAPEPEPIPTEDDEIE